MVVYVIAILLIISLDLKIKSLVSRKIKLNGYKTIMKNKVFITNVRNDGAALGLFQNNKKILLAITLASIITLIYMLCKKVMLKQGTLEKISIAFLLGGGLANLIERLKKGYVVDYVSIQKFPIFNLADVFVFLGAVVYFFVKIKEELL